MSSIHIISRPPEKKYIDRGFLKEASILQDNFVPFNPGDTISLYFNLRISPDEDILSLTGDNSSGVEFYDLADEWGETGDGKIVYAVVLRFTVVKKRHSMSAYLSDGSLHLKQPGTELIIAPVSDDVEKVYRWIQDYERIHGEGSVLPF